MMTLYGNSSTPSIPSSQRITAGIIVMGCSMSWGMMEPGYIRRKSSVR